MHRGRSFWFLVATLCMGVAVLGLGCERTISDFELGGTGGSGGSGGTGGTGPADGANEFQNDLDNPS